jgi:type I restriction enzyme, S subunit
MLKHKMPPNWIATTLDKHAEVRSGLAKGKKDIRDATQRPYLRVANVQDGYLDLDEIKMIEVSRADVDRYSLKVGDVLLTEGGDFDKLGRGAVWRGEIDGCLHQNHVFVVRPNEAELLPEFLSYQAASTYGKRYFQACSKQSTNLASINSTQLKQFPLLMAPIVEQRKIVDFVHTWDLAIHRTEELVSQKKNQLAWIRAQLLSGKQRFRGFSQDWLKPKLSEILIEHGLKSGGDEEVFSVSVHRGLVNQIEHLGRSFAAKETGHYNRVRPGDIVYTKSPTGEFPLGIIKISRAQKDVIVSPLYGVFTPKTGDIGPILDAVFESATATKNYLAPLVQKGPKNTIAITNKRFLEGRVAIPSDPAERSALIALVTTAKLEIDRLHDAITLLERQRRGLIDKLLTGAWCASSSSRKPRLVPEEAAE